jgi:peptidoglycan/xylan/chitin deacetylase (PgdA/CDA1 family)
MIRNALELLSPSGPRARLSVLIFHRVLAVPDPLFPDLPDARQFDRICSWLGDWFNVVRLDEGARRLRDGTLPERALAITFDDGYADNHDVALPLLVKRGFPATFFIATGFVDGGVMWNDVVIEALRRTSRSSIGFAGADGKAMELSLTSARQRREAIDMVLKAIKYVPQARRSELALELATSAGIAVPRDMMMSSRQLKGLHDAGMQLGAHTVSHPILARLDREQALREIGDSKDYLETLLGERIRLFAYPNGKPEVDFTDDHVLIATRLGFEAAVSTAAGAASKWSDPFKFPRFTPWDSQRLRFGGKLVRNLWSSRPRERRAG